MIPLEYTCIVLLLGCLGMSTFELTTELIRHWRVKSRSPMLRCCACGGPTMKVHWHVIIIFSMQLHPLNYSPAPPLFSIAFWGCTFCLTSTNYPARAGVTRNIDPWVHQPGDQEPTTPNCCAWQWKQHGAFGVNPCPRQKTAHGSLLRSSIQGWRPMPSRPCRGLGSYSP